MIPAILRYMALHPEFDINSQLKFLIKLAECDDQLVADMILSGQVAPNLATALKLQYLPLPALAILTLQDHGGQIELSNLRIKSATVQGIMLASDEQLQGAFEQFPNSTTVQGVKFINDPENAPLPENTSELLLVLHTALSVNSAQALAAAGHAAVRGEKTLLGATIREAIDAGCNVAQMERFIRQPQLFLSREDWQETVNSYRGTLSDERRREFDVTGAEPIPQ